MTSKQAGQISGVFGGVVLASAVINWFQYLVTGGSAMRVLIRVAIGVVALAVWLITNRGERVAGKGAFYTATSTVSVLVLLAALVGANYIAVKKPKSWDLTKDRIFTLSDQTTGVLKGLKDEVKVQAFYSAAEPEFTDLDQRLRQYRSYTDKLQVEIVDPLRHPGLVKEMNISQSGPRVVIKSGNKEARAKDTSEEALTNALLEVTRGSTKKVYFTKGHGEHAVGDGSERGMKLFVDSLKSEGFQTDEIVLAEHKQMPQDAAALVIAGPVAALTDGEAKLVKDWVDNKSGKLVAMIDTARSSNLESAFAAWGVKLGNDEVIDADSQNPEYAIAQSYADHPITTPRSSPFAVATIFPVARSVQKLPTAPAGWNTTELAKTGPRSWGETSPIKEGRVEFNPGQDLKGPVTLAIVATKGSGDNESRVVVIGNSSFAANGFYRLGGNRDFALNAVSWAAREEQRISIRPKQRQANHLFLSADQRGKLRTFALDLLPFSLLFAGLVVWQTRKSR